MIIYKLFLLHLFIERGAPLDAISIRDYFNTYDIHYGCIFNCSPLIDRINLTKSLMNENLRISESYIKGAKTATMTNSYLFSYRIGLVVDGDCEEVEGLLEKAADLNLFNDRMYWLVISSNDSVVQFFTKISTNIDSNIRVLVANQDDTRKVKNGPMTIVDVYNPAFQRGGKLNRTQVGLYKPSDDNFKKQSENKYWARKNLTDVTFKTMVVIRLPYEGTLQDYLDSDENRHRDTLTRFPYIINRICKDFYNFSMNINVTDSWGYMDDKKQFSGMVGAVQRKEIDFGSSTVYIKAERIEFIDFARGLWLFKSTFIFRHPTERSFGQIFLHPMASSVWFLTVASMILVVLLLKFTQSAELKIVKDFVHSMDEKWSTLILFVLGVFCQQGSSHHVVLLCGRIITISVLLFCLLFYQFYSGSIVSNLLTKSPITIKNLKDLMASSLDIGSEDTPYMRDYFQTTNDPTVYELYRRKFGGGRTKANYFSPEEGMTMVEKEGFAFNVERTLSSRIMGETFSNKAICELAEVYMFPVTFLMPIFQKRSPFREMMNYCYHRIAEHGIGARLKKHWSPLRPQCLQTHDYMSFQVSVKDIYPAIALLGAGVCLSFIILLIENCLKKFMKNKRATTQSYPFVN